MCKLKELRVWRPDCALRASGQGRLGQRGGGEGSHFGELCCGGAKDSLKILQ